MSQSRVAERFDQWAKLGKGEKMARGHWPMVSQILEQMVLRPGLRCLDVGCGNGYAVHAMAKPLGATGLAVGVDISPAMIDTAQRQPVESECPVQFWLRDQVPVSGWASMFDRLLSVEALYYMENPADEIRQWFQWLAEGGSAWVMVDYYQENAYSKPWGALLDLPLHRVSEQTYRQWFEEAGFEQVRLSRLFNVAPADEAEKAAFQPGWGYETWADVENFRARIGSLLITGVKPSLLSAKDAGDQL